ncbi:MAG TPA: alpha/beta hydrolase [Nitrososphaeraceae archaeon]|nr:alpha/beta hydrolase [Nitrososphaeraceae archaeon]
MSRQTTVKKIQIHGNNIRYLDYDNFSSKKSENLVLLHGIGASAGRWSNVIPFLYKHFRVIVPDIIGFGYSDKPTVEYTMPFFVKFLEDFLNSLGIKKTSMGGSSFGGLVAAEFAIKNTSMVNKLILVSPAGTMKISTKTLEEYILAALYPTHDNVWRAFINMAFDPRTVTEQTIEDFIDRMKLPNAKYAFMSTMMGIRNTTNLSSRLNKILSPTIIVWGEQDEMIPMKYAEVYRNIPNSNLKVIPKCGHTPFTEKPEVFSKIAIDFLKGFNSIK